MSQLVKIMLLVGLMAFLGACAPEGGYPVVKMSDLLAQPETYKNQTIVVQGQVTSYLGEDDSFLLLPYTTVHPCMMGKVSTICSQINLSVSQVRVGKFMFSDGKFGIEVQEREGGLYLPIVFVPAGKPTLPKERISITGNWVKDRNGKYYLYVEGTTPIATPTP